MAEGKKNRKVGKSKRKPTRARYLAEKGWERNKTRRIAKEKARQSACAKARQCDDLPSGIQRRIRIMRRKVA